LLREAVSVSKQLVNHLEAITLLICHDNLARAVA
jgi:hypothetical protein